jgi:hypothetical protein
MMRVLSGAGMVQAKEKKRKTEGWVYFIQWASMPYHVKIGFSTSPGERFASFLTSSPDTLIVVKAFEANRDDEKDLHERFDNSRHAGEWFHLSMAIKKYLESEAPCQTLEAKIKFGHKNESRIQWTPMRPGLAQSLEKLHQEKRLPRYVKNARTFVLWAIGDIEACDYFATSNAIIHHEANRDAYQAKTIYNQLIALEEEEVIVKKPGKTFTLLPKGESELIAAEKENAQKRKSARSLRLD